MGCALVSVLLLVCCLSGSLAAQFSFYNDDYEYDDDYDTPTYTVVEEAETYEIRQYMAAKWVCTEADAHHKRSSKAMMTMFWALFEYISGENTADMSIAMTSPVTSTAWEVAGGHMRYQMCFFLPYDHQQQPPAPSDPQVYIEPRPLLQAAVRTYVATPRRAKAQFEQQKEALINDLKQDGHKGVLTPKCYSAGLDPPMKKNPRYEVWVVLE